MSGVDRLERILGRLAAQAGPEAGPAALCAVGRELLAVSGAGLLLLSDPELRVSVEGGDAVMARMHQLQLDLGEGPALDAHSHGAVVLEPNLAEARRWPAFAPAAVRGGALAIFCVPARVGAVRLGTFSAWQDQPRELTDEQHRDLHALGGVAARLLLDLHAGASPSEIVVTGDDFEFDSVVHQAVGMLSVQLGVSLHVALVRLRAHAFSAGIPVAAAAAAVLARGLRLESDGPNGTTS